MHRGQFAERFEPGYVQPVIDAAAKYGVIAAGSRFPIIEAASNVAVSIRSRRFRAVSRRQSSLYRSERVRAGTRALFLRCGTSFATRVSARAGDFITTTVADSQSSCAARRARGARVFNTCRIGRRKSCAKSAVTRSIHVFLSLWTYDSRYAHGRARGEHV